MLEKPGITFFYKIHPNTFHKNIKRILLIQKMLKIMSASILSRNIFNSIKSPLHLFYHKISMNSAELSIISTMAQYYRILSSLFIFSWYLGMERRFLGKRKIVLRIVIANKNGNR